MSFAPLQLIRNYLISQPFRGRYRILQNMMMEARVHTLWIEDKSTIFHLTHQNFSQAVLIAHVHGAFELWLDGRYFAQSQTKGWKKELWDETGPERIFASRLKSGMHIESGVSCARFSQVKAWADRAQLPLELWDKSLQKARIIKDKSAQTALRKAARLNDEGFRFIRTLLAPGVCEREIAKELEIYWLRHNGQGVAFDPIIAFGSNSACPHHKSGDRRLRTGDIVLIDIGVSVQGYQSDMTRTFFFGGAESALVEAFESVKRAYELGISLCRDGINLEEIDHKVRELLKQDGLDGYFTHSLGHGIGVEVHEEPFFRRKKPLILKEGMVLTIEPGVYLPRQGGIRLEDTVLITKQACEVLSSHPICDQASPTICVDGH